jgi:HEPN domain-containing protein
MDKEKISSDLNSVKINKNNGQYRGYQMKDEVKKWIEQAERDFLAAKNSFKSGDYSASTFWCQQIAEKSFKALIIFKGLGLPKIHDLLTLSRKLDAKNNIIDMAIMLNPFYTVNRYPDILLENDITKKDNEEALKYAEIILKWCKSQIKI